MPGGLDILALLRANGFHPMQASFPKSLSGKMYIGYKGKVRVGILTGSREETEVIRLESLLDELFGSDNYSVDREGTGPWGPYTSYLVVWDTDSINWDMRV